MKIARQYKKFYKKAKTQVDKNNVIMNLIADLNFIIKEIGEYRWKHDIVDTFKTLDRQFTEFADYINIIDGPVIDREEFRYNLVDCLPNANTKFLFEGLGWDFEKHYKRATGKEWDGQDLYQKKLFNKG